MKNHKFDKIAELIKHLPYKNDTDVYIQTVGYHNFDFVKPIKWIHRQLEYTIHFVLDGSGTLYLGGKEFSIKEGQMFFLTPADEFMYYPNKDEPWKYLWFNFSGKQAELLGENLGFSAENPIKNIKNFKKLAESVFDILEEMDKGRLNEYKAKGLFYNIIGSQTVSDTDESVTLSQSCFDEAVRFLERNFARSDLSIDTLCSLLYVSHSSLCKTFKTTVGMTPVKYLIQLRMHNAAELLVDESFSVRKIAELSGYSDEIHFMKTFKKYFGTTPSEYRQGLKRNN
jgi:AraC-like DNA-binding protein/mannose-6-phosphate isomerase-like protein (cupin superfamily)